MQVTGKRGWKVPGQQQEALMFPKSIYVPQINQWAPSWNPTLMCLDHQILFCNKCYPFVLRMSWIDSMVHMHETESGVSVPLATFYSSVAG